MKFLDEERELFREVSGEFTKEYRNIIEEMVDTYEGKAETYEGQTGQPMHHRLQPEDKAHEMATKARRVKALVSHEGWWGSIPALEDIIEECVDGANYFLYLAAFCRMRKHELMGPPVHHSSPRAEEEVHQAPLPVFEGLDDMIEEDEESHYPPYLTDELREKIDSLEPPDVDEGRQEVPTTRNKLNIEDDVLDVKIPGGATVHRWQTPDATEEEVQAAIKLLSQHPRYRVVDVGPRGDSDRARLDAKVDEALMSSEGE